MSNPRHNKQTANRRGAMGGGLMNKRPGYKKGTPDKLVGGQVKIASAAPPKNVINKADFKALKRKA